MAYWIKAARLRTLPLAFSCILLGTFLAAADGSFDLWILVLSLLTTLFFQVLSNYANDLGDGVKGTDQHRRGEPRMVGSGLIPIEKMKGAVYLFVSHAGHSLYSLAQHDGSLVSQRTKSGPNLIHQKF